MARYALRVDANQAAVISALEAAGATVQVVGKPLDLLVGACGLFALFEVKDGNKSPSRRKHTKEQAEFFKKWAGYPICTVDSPECALRHLRVLAAHAAQLKSRALFESIGEEVSHGAALQAG